MLSLRSIKRIKPLNLDIMYYSIKAFNGTQRRFENLDNIYELNEFVYEFWKNGFNKFIVRSFDSDGFRKRTFMVTNSDFAHKLFVPKNQF